MSEDHKVFHTGSKQLSNQVSSFMEYEASDKLGYLNFLIPSWVPYHHLSTPPIPQAVGHSREIFGDQTNHWYHNNYFKPTPYCWHFAHRPVFVRRCVKILYESLDYNWLKQPQNCITLGREWTGLFLCWFEPVPCGWLNISSSLHGVLILLAVMPEY